MKIERGEFVREWNEDTPYKRYLDTPTGVSPRALPGTANTLYVSASDEHNERGEVISDVFTDPPTRKKMVEKRFRKMDFAKKELQKLYPVKLEGSANADITLVGWGSTINLLRALTRRLEQEGIKANILLIQVVAPFLSEDVAAILKSVKHPVIIEQNFTSQMARLIRMETGISIGDKINKYDGEPFSASEVLVQLKKLMEKGTPAVAGVAR